MLDNVGDDSIGGGALDAFPKAFEAEKTSWAGTLSVLISLWVSQTYNYIF